MAQSGRGIERPVAFITELVQKLFPHDSELKLKEELGDPDDEGGDYPDSWLPDVPAASLLSRLVNGTFDNLWRQDTLDPEKRPDDAHVAQVMKQLNEEAKWNDLKEWLDIGTETTRLDLIHSGIRRQLVRRWGDKQETRDFREQQRLANDDGVDAEHDHINAQDPEHEDDSRTASADYVSDDINIIVSRQRIDGGNGDRRRDEHVDDLPPSRSTRSSRGGKTSTSNTGLTSIPRASRLGRARMTDSESRAGIDSDQFPLQKRRRLDENQSFVQMPRRSIEDYDAEDEDSLLDSAPKIKRREREPDSNPKVKRSKREPWATIKLYLRTATKDKFVLAYTQQEKPEFFDQLHESLLETVSSRLTSHEFKLYSLSSDAEMDCEEDLLDIKKTSSDGAVRVYYREK